MDFWEQLTRECASLTSTEPDDIANMANVSSALFHALNAARQNSINWCGFYRNLDDSCLVLGPFQGRVACIRIPFGKGVCGACALSGEAQVVPDVHKFPGHIACDSASQSELVVPIRRDGKLLGVLDIDSSVVNCFSDVDAKGAALLLDAAFGRPVPPEPPKREIKHVH